MIATQALLDSMTRRTSILKVYFRDDDAGWEDAALMRLLDLFAMHQTPLDLAVIPNALHAELARMLAAAAARQPLGIHQHGHSHTNHELSGRKCEFGVSRDADLQYADIQAGALAMQSMLGELTQPIFTPPWNRCTQDTADALDRLGFHALSRDAGAAPLALGHLQSLPVHLDWQKRATGKHTLHDAPDDSDTLGIMLHHAVMTHEDHLELEDLLENMRTLPWVRLVGMGECLAQSHSMNSVVANKDRSRTGEKNKCES